MKLTEQQKELIAKRELRGLKDIERCMNYFKNPRKTLAWGAIISSIGTAHEHLAVKQYFIEHNIPAFKQHAYLFTQSDLVAMNRGYGSDEMDWNLLLFALLSDSPKTIEGVGLVAPRFIRAAGNKPQSIYFWVHLYQLVMLNKIDEVAQRLEQAKTQVKKQQRQALIEGKDFFSLLLARDKAGLEKLILEKAQNDKTTEHDNPWIGGLISAIPTIEAKLCWLKGIEVEIDHPLIPMELLLIKPLEHYDDVYDFLNPDWTPPTQNFIQKMIKLISK